MPYNCIGFPKAVHPHKDPSSDQEGVAFMRETKLVRGRARQSMHHGPVRGVGWRLGRHSGATEVTQWLLSSPEACILDRCWRPISSSLIGLGSKVGQLWAAGEAHKPLGDPPPRGHSSDRACPSPQRRQSRTVRRLSGTPGEPLYGLLLAPGSHKSRQAHIGSC